MLLFADYDVDG